MEKRDRNQDRFLVRQELVLYIVRRLDGILLSDRNEEMFYEIMEGQTGQLMLCRLDETVLNILKVFFLERKQ